MSPDKLFIYFISANPISILYMLYQVRFLEMGLYHDLKYRLIFCILINPALTHPKACLKMVVCFLRTKFYVSFYDLLIFVPLCTLASLSHNDMFLISFLNALGSCPFGPFLSWTPRYFSATFCQFLDLCSVSCSGYPNPSTMAWKFGARNQAIHNPSLMWHPRCRATHDANMSGCC